MEFFRDTNIDFLGKKWYFLTFSLIFSIAGVLSMAFWHGIPLGVDFRGGTLVYVKYSHSPDPAAIHNEIERAGLGALREWLTEAVPAAILAGAVIPPRPEPPAKPSRRGMRWLSGRR